MSAARQVIWSGLALLALAAGTAAPAQAQGRAHGKNKYYAVSAARAVTVTRTVLVRQGYEVVRVQHVGPTQVVYYRPGKKWRGKGQRPVHRMVIRAVENRVVFEDTEPAVLVDIDVRLKL